MIKSMIKESPLMLLIHSFTILPSKIKGIKLKNIKNNGTMSTNSKPLIEYTIAHNNFALGSKLWTNVFFF